MFIVGNHKTGHLPLWVRACGGAGVVSLFCGVFLVSNPVIGKRYIHVADLLFVNCAVAVCFLCPFRTVPWVGLQSVIAVFLSHTHFIF